MRMHPFNLISDQQTEVKLTTQDSFVENIKGNISIVLKALHCKN